MHRLLYWHRASISKCLCSAYLYVEESDEALGNAIALRPSTTTALFRFFPGGIVKKIVLALAVAVAIAATASAQTATKAPASKAASQTKAAPAAMAPAAKAKATKAEVVSTDPAAKTITVKDSSGSNMTLTATGTAVAALAKVKAGDWVMVTHTDTNATKIVKVKAAGVEESQEVASASRGTNSERTRRDPRRYAIQPAACAIAAIAKGRRSPGMVLTGSRVQ